MVIENGLFTFVVYYGGGEQVSVSGVHFNINDNMSVVFYDRNGRECYAISPGWDRIVRE